LTDYAGNQSVVATSISLISPLLVPSLVSISLDSNPKYMWITGSVTSARPGASLKASSGGLFSGNSGSAIADSSGAFRIKLKAFTTATLIATDSSRNETTQVTLNFGAATTLAGNVQDVFGNPLVGATVSMSNCTQTVQTDQNGNFSFSNPSTGDQLLAINGSTMLPNSVGPAKSYSVSHLAINVGIGQTNVLNGTVYMTPLMMDGSQVPIDRLSGGQVTSTYAPGVQLNIPAGAARFPNGSSSSAVNMMTVKSKFVTTPVPRSFVPTNVISLEPSGTQFSKPVTLTLPNDNNLPAGTPMVIFSMNSATGQWVQDGQASVDSGGQTITTVSGSGITHFSSVYAVPLAPMIFAMSNPNLAGIDVSNGGISEAIKAPSFKILGQTVTPTVSYKSLWANPTAFVSASIQIPNPANISSQGVDSGTSVQTVYNAYFTNCWPVAFGAENCATEWLNEVASNNYTRIWQSTNMWIPQSISSQFFVGTVSTDQPPIALPSYSDNSANISQITNGTPISNAAATQLLTQSGIPTSSVVAYALQLVDPASGQYLSSGIHPSIASFQVNLQNLTITTYSSFNQISINANGKYAGGTNNVTTGTQVSSNLVSTLPQDLQQDILVQNKSASSSGRGWQVNGAERIYNPTNTKVMIEESSGAVSTYALNNTINTLFNGANSSVDLSHGVDISQWPTAYMIGNDGVQNSWMSSVDLSSQSATAQQLGALFHSTGQVANQGYANCNVVNGLYQGTFTPTLYRFGIS